jgi:hypothetical protein
MLRTLPGTRFLEEVGLAPGFVDGDRRGVREIERPTTGSDWDPQAFGHGRMIECRSGEPDGLTAEEQGVAVGIGDIRVAGLGVLGEGEQTNRIDRIDERFEIVVNVNVGVLPVVEAGPPEPGIIEIEPERSYQMQTIPGIDAQPHEIPGIGRDLRLMENDVEHRSALNTED